MGTYGGLCGALGTNGGLWGPMGTYGDLWAPMGTYGHLWGPTGTYGGLWGPMGTLRCQRLFVGSLFAIFEFLAALVCKLRVWLHLQKATVPRSELRPRLDNLLEWQRTRQVVTKWKTPKGPRPVLSLTAEMRTDCKKQKYASHIEQTITALGGLQELGWDVVFTAGSSKRVRGWEQAGFGGFYGEGDARNFAHPVDPLELQTNGRAKVRAILFSMRQCTGLTPMAVPTDSEFCFNGLPKHLLLWERRDALGVSHADQWVRILELARDPSKQYKFFCRHTYPLRAMREQTDREAGRLLHEYNMQPPQKC